MRGATLIRGLTNTLVRVNGEKSVSKKSKITIKYECIDFVTNIQDPNVFIIKIISKRG